MMNIWIFWAEHLQSEKCTHNIYSMKSKNDKRNLAHMCLRSVQGIYWRWRLVTMGDGDNESTTIFYLSDAANSGKSLIRVLSEDKDVFVLLVCWLSREVMECKVHMEQWNMTMPCHSVCSRMACTLTAIATWLHIQKRVFPHCSVSHQRLPDSHSW